MRKMMLFVAISYVAVLVGFSFAASAEDAEYIGHTQCKVCHNKKAEGAQWDAWKTEKHSKSYETLKSDKAKEVAAKAGVTTAPNEAPECLRCHATAYDPATKAVPAKLKLEDGVQCETCHGAGSLHQKDGKILMFQKDKAATVDIKAHRVEVTEAMCVKCHNSENPTWDPERYTLPDGKKVGFDFKQATEKITHPNPVKAAAKK